MPYSCDRKGMWDRRVSIGHTSNANSGMSILEPLMELIIEHCTGKCNHSISNEMVRKHDERGKHMIGQDKEEEEDALIDILKIVVEECKTIYKNAQIKVPSSRTSKIQGVSFVTKTEAEDSSETLPCQLPPKEMNP
ncbi:hypothetical protein Tco_0111681 [Tanacetum coccineum]